MTPISERWIVWADVSGSTRFAAEIYGKNGRQDDGGKLSKEFRPYWTAIMDLYERADKLARNIGGGLANTMGDGFFLLGPPMRGHGDFAQWVPSLLLLSRNLKGFADKRLLAVGSMKLKICLHTGTVHEVPHAGKTSYFGDCLNYAARVLGAAYKVDPVSIDDIIATGEGPTVGSGHISGIAHLIRDHGYIEASAGEDIAVGIRYPTEPQTVQVRRFPKEVWTEMPIKGPAR